MLIASWNIEKNGQSSADVKRTMVSGFIDYCLADLNVDLLFLCEVHSARVDDYVTYIISNYINYSVTPIHGGYSNCYLVIQKRTGNITVVGDEHLQGLNRSLAIVHVTSLHFDFNGLIGLAHFKSGRTSLTRDQIRGAVDFLNDASNGSYFITGDLNWDYNDFARLAVDAERIKQWDITQRRGGCLDWAIFGRGTLAASFDFSALGRSNPDLFSMNMPDHKPVIFEISSL